MNYSNLAHAEHEFGAWPLLTDPRPRTNVDAQLNTAAHTDVVTIYETVVPARSRFSLVLASAGAVVLGLLLSIAILLIGGAVALAVRGVLELLSQVWPGMLAQAAVVSPVLYAATSRTPVRSTPSHRLSDAELDRILEDSFPASDPPPWTLGRGAPEVISAPSDDRYLPAAPPSAARRSRPPSSQSSV